MGLWLLHLITGRWLVGTTTDQHGQWRVDVNHPEHESWLNLLSGWEESRKSLHYSLSLAGQVLGADHLSQLHGHFGLHLLEVLTEFLKIGHVLGKASCGIQKTKQKKVNKYVIYSIIDKMLSFGELKVVVWRSYLVPERARQGWRWGWTSWLLTGRGPAKKSII